MKRNLFIIGLCLMVVQVQAQTIFQRYIHNVDFGLGGGLHSVQFDPAVGGEHNMRAGFTCNAQYRYAGFSSERWSVATGLGFTTYSAKSTYDYMQDQTEFTDVENGETYHFKTTFINWTEVQRSLNLEIPIAAYYRYPLNEMWGLVGGGGFKMDIPISKKYKTKNENSDGEMVRSGYFESTNVEYEELPQHGFYNSEEYDGKAKMKGLGVSIFAEIGATRPLKNNMSLYIGTYISHSLTNSLKSCDNLLYNPETEKYSGVVSSNLVDKTHLFALGIKAGLSFGYPKAPQIDTLAERLLAEQLEAERLAKEKAVQDSIAEVERLAKVKAMQDSLAEVQRIVAEKNRLDSIAEAERRETERIAAEELAKAEAAVEWINKHIVVNFELGKAVIQPNAEIDANIEFLTKFLADYPERILLIKGHTCDLGNYQKNKILSKNRAEAMKKILVERGCKASSIETIGMGSDEPLVPNTCEENRKKNRRIEITIEHIKKE